MTPPRFRRHHRSPGGRRPVLDGDPGDGQAVTEAIAAAAPAPWDGTTVPLSALRGEPRYTSAPAAPLPPGVPAPTPEALDVVRYLRAKVAILRRRRQLDRISDDKLAMLPALRLTRPHEYTTARQIVDEAAVLLRSGGAS